MKRLIFFIIIIANIALPALLIAQEDQKKMEDSVLKALTAFENGKYRASAESYAEAFRFYKDYNLKKNEMIAWFKSGNCEPAVDAANLYLKRGKGINDADRTDVKSVRVRCELVFAKKSLHLGNTDRCESHLNLAEEIIAADTFAPLQGSEESHEIEVVRKKLRLFKKDKTIEAPKKEEEQGSYLGPILVGSGALLSIGGIALILSSLSAETDLQCNKNIVNPSCDNPKEITEKNYNEQLSSIKTQNAIGWVTTILGAAVIGTGTYLWLEDNLLSVSYSPKQNTYRVDIGTTF